MTAVGHRYGENRLATMQRKNITDALAGKTLIMQKVWLKALRHWIAWAIEPWNGLHHRGGKLLLVVDWLRTMATPS